MLVGIFVATSIIYASLASLSGLVVPLVVSIVIGVLVVRVVDRLQAAGLPRRVGVALVMIGLFAAGIGSIWTAVGGVVQQGPEIGAQVAAGIETLDEVLMDAGLLDDVETGLFDRLEDVLPQAAAGVAGVLSNAFSGVVAFLVGTFVAVFFLYYLLTDWEKLVDWLARHLGAPDDLSVSIIEDTMLALREYFKGLSIASIIVAAIIGLTMWALGLPLAFTVALVTFATAYIPYLGAIFSGAFAFLVAIGSGGIGQALVVLAVILVAQNLVQTLVQNKLTSDQLSIHPIVNFGSTIVGIALAGVLGATLSAPIVASLIRMTNRVRSYRTGIEPSGAG
jgi:predicted PurR-regulated permease PerM